MMEFLTVLSREEMKNVKGRGGYLTCDGCQNSTCQGWVDECSQIAVYQMCGPGYAGENGPIASCVEAI